MKIYTVYEENRGMGELGEASYYTKDEAAEHAAKSSHFGVLETELYIFDKCKNIKIEEATDSVSVLKNIIPNIRGKISVVEAESIRQSIEVIVVELESMIDLNPQTSKKTCVPTKCKNINILCVKCVRNWDDDVKDYYTE